MSTVRDPSPQRSPDARAYLALLGRVAVREQTGLPREGVVVCTFTIRTGEPERAFVQVRELLRPTGHTAFREGEPERGLLDLVAVSSRPDLGVLQRLGRAGFEVFRAKWFLLADLPAIPELQSPELQSLELQEPGKVPDRLRPGRPPAARSGSPR